ncbi:MAG TPA: hypothetical protein PLN54_04705 [Flavobacteriales bacterium]|nr:hypothetical protein [Flavobacteriales bacterium]
MAGKELHGEVGRYGVEAQGPLRETLRRLGNIFRSFKKPSPNAAPPQGTYGENLNPPSVQSYKINPRGIEQPVIEDKRGQVPDDYIAKYVRWTVETSAWMQQNTGGKNKPLLRVTATLKNVTVSDGSPVKVQSIATLFGEDGSILEMKRLSTPPNSLSQLGSVGVAEFKLASPNTQGLLPSYRLEVETILQVNAHGSWYTPTRIGTFFVPNTSITEFRISSNPF